MPSLTVKDHSVPHISTLPMIPPNPGQTVQLFVREYRKTGGPQQPPVLMLHGRSVPAVAGFDLVIPGSGGSDIRYSWAQQLAQHGFDVFLMDLQGSGRTPRPLPMDQPCNANPAQQESVLVPNPLSAKCPPPYGYQLGNSESEEAEVDTVVKFIKTQTGTTGPIDFIGWSAGALVMGPYTLKHPENVKSLFLLAPMFPPKGRWSGDAMNPFARPSEAAALPLSTPALTFGFPMHVASKTGFKIGWDKEQASPLQREPDMGDIVWDAMMANDALGSTWGPIPPGGTAEGVLRYRNSYWWGWNNHTVPLKDASGTYILGDRVPVMIVYGEMDRTANTPPTPPLPDVLTFSVPSLYKAIPGSKKLMFELADAGHSVVWERPAKVVQHMSMQWFDKHRVEDQTSGSFYRDDDGLLTPLD
ncbi:Lysophospholipase, alpha-beta hydrolase superfamily [Streptomyces sp. Ag109_O5-10]|nr:alpha/beta fold hydrolase [Streptomyces sp. Ag109_O5-10]SEE17945.1 Lysophospholipase, alpha-beta hydrolase superfamily [Streptomyces sp. Ag109_O5-10]